MRLLPPPFNPTCRMPAFVAEYVRILIALQGVSAFERSSALATVECSFHILLFFTIFIHKNEFITW